MGGKTGERAKLSMLMTEVMADVFISRATPPLIFSTSSKILEAIDLWACSCILVELAFTSTSEGFRTPLLSP
jgi:hypothetical protein